MADPTEDESYVGVIHQVLLGPRFRSLYDMVLTTRRFVLVYLEEDTPVSSLPLMDPWDYTRGSPSELGATSGRVEVMRDDVIEVVVKQRGTIPLIIIKCYERRGTQTEMKIMFHSDSSIHDFVRYPRRPGAPQKVDVDMLSDYESLVQLLSVAFTQNQLKTQHAH